MIRKRVLSAVLAVIVATSLTGCIFLPTMAEGSDDTSSRSDGADDQNDSTSPDPESDGPSESESDDPTESEDITENDDVTEWPESIPLPEGEPVEGNDSPGFYLVEGDIEFYIQYTETLLDLPDAELIDHEDREDRNPSVVIRIGEYRILVMHHPSTEWVSASVNYDFT